MSCARSRQPEPVSPGLVGHPIGTRLRPRELNTWWYASGVPASADYDVEADFVLLTDEAFSNGMGVAGRVDTTAATGYEARFDVTGDEYQIRKVVATPLVR